MVTRSKSFLTAEWRDLVLVNYAVDPSLLGPLVPRGTELDLWDGRALISLVGFRFINTRVLGVAIWGHRHFYEVNLRFYVRRVTPEGVRRGVVFVRELVPSPAIAYIARLVYNEPYRAVPMRHSSTSKDISRSLVYEWRERRQAEWCGVRATTVGPPAPLVAGSQAEFISEHFWGYTRQRDGGTVEYQVAHPSWRVWETADSQLIGDVSRTYGPTFGKVITGGPFSTFVAEGSEVTVYRPRRLSS